MFKFYIGSNNVTKKLELRKIESILNSQVDGYTVYKAKGCWKGNKENTAIVEIQGITKDKALQIAGNLRDNLQQDAVALQEVEDMLFI